MKFELNRLCLGVFVLVVRCECYKEPLPLPDASPEIFPFHALVKGVTTCNGILISEDYVITPASCVSGAETVSVFLGFRGYPYFLANHNEPNVQNYKCSKAIIHEDYVKVEDSRHLNNIALVKLPHPAPLSKNIHPGKLITKEESSELTGKYVNVTGWMISQNTKLKIAEVQLRNEDTCRFLFGEHYFRSQELCIRWLVDTQHLNLMGNPVSANGKIIGYQTSTPPCVDRHERTCTRNDMVLSIVPFLDWIATHTNIETTQITEPKNHDSHIMEKFEHLSEVIKAAKEQQRADVARLDKKLEELTNSLQSQQNEIAKNSLKIDEQVNDMRSEIRRIETNQNASILNLQENIANARTEVTNGLSAQKSLSDSFAQRLAAVDTRQNTEDERIPAIQQALEGIKHQTEANAHHIDELAANFKPEIDFVKTELSNFGHKAELIQSQVNDYYYEITHSIKNATTSVDYQFHVLNSDIDKLSEKLQHQELKAHETYGSLNVTLNHISTRTEAEYIKICKRLDSLEKDVHENIEHINIHTIKGNIHLEDIINELKEQKHVQESLKKCCYSEYDIPSQ